MCLSVVLSSMPPVVVVEGWEGRGGGGSGGGGREAIFLGRGIAVCELLLVCLGGRGAEKERFGKGRGVGLRGSYIYCNYLWW